MGKDERRPAGVNVGGASIVMIFAVLCLTVFAVLSLISANAEYKLSQKLSNSVSAYYDADCRGEDTLAAVRGAVADGGGLDAIGGRVTALGLSVQNSGGKLYIGFTEDIDDRQGINILLSTDGRTVDVLRWCVEDTVDWVFDDDFHVWDGTTP